MIKVSYVAFGIFAETDSECLVNTLYNEQQNKIGCIHVRIIDINFLPSITQITLFMFIPLLSGIRIFLFSMTDEIKLFSHDDKWDKTICLQWK